LWKAGNQWRGGHGGRGSDELSTTQTIGHWALLRRVEITTDVHTEKDMNETDRKRFEKRLLDERARIAGVLNRMNTVARSDEQRDQDGDLSVMPTHPADLGSDEQQRELETSVNQNEADTLAEIDAALERLYRTPEQYGIDERTKKPIPLARLEVIPWARYDVGGQAEIEEREGA
jgi:RNA polymerase-binding transcription factor DksA